MREFQSGNTEINNTNILCYILNCNLQTLPFQMIPHSLVRFNGQLDPKCQTRIHIVVYINNFSMLTISSLICMSHTFCLRLNKTNMNTLAIILSE